MIERSRIDNLKAAVTREKSALDAASERVAVVSARAAELRRLISMHRQAVATRTAHGQRQDIADLEKQRDALPDVIGEAMAALETQRERVSAATRLRKRCEDFLKEQGVAA